MWQDVTSKVLWGLASRLVRFNTSINKILNIRMLMRTQSWDSLATKRRTRNHKEASETPVVEDLLVSAEKLCASGQSQEFLLGAGVPHLGTQRGPRTESYSFLV